MQCNAGSVIMIFFLFLSIACTEKDSKYMYALTGGQKSPELYENGNDYNKYLKTANNSSCDLQNQ